MKRIHIDEQGQEIVEKLDDVTPPPPPRSISGPPPAPDAKFMETWDVLQAPHPVHGKPAPDEDEDDKWGGS